MNYIARLKNAGLLVGAASFLCLPGNSLATPVKESGKIVREGQIIATFTRELSHNGQQEVRLKKIWSLSGKLTSQRRVIYVNDRFTQLSDQNFEFQSTASVQLVNGTYVIASHSGNNTSYKAKDSLEYLTFDSVPHFVKRRWTELNKGKALGASMISLNSGELLEVSFHNSKKSKTQGNQIQIHMTPESFSKKLLMKTLGLQPSFFLTLPKFKVHKIRGPLFGVPGQNPKKGGKPFFGEMHWDS